VECYLRLMFLKFRYRLGYESLCAEVSDPVSAAANRLVACVNDGAVVAGTAAWGRPARLPLRGTRNHVPAHAGGDGLRQKRTCPARYSLEPALAGSQLAAAVLVLQQYFVIDCLSSLVVACFWRGTGGVFASWTRPRRRFGWGRGLSGVP
jgi:hypothetical protein